MSLLVCLVFFSLWFTGGSVQHFEIIKKPFWLFEWKCRFSVHLCVKASEVFFSWSLCLLSRLRMRPRDSPFVKFKKRQHARCLYSLILSSTLICVCVCVCVWGILVRVPTALSFRYGIELGDRFRSFWGILTTSGLRSSLSPIDPRCDISVQTHTRTHAHWHGCSFSVFLHHSSNLSGIVENKAHHAWAYMNVPTHTLYMWFTGALHRHNDKLCFLYPNTMPHRQLLAFFSVWYFLCGVCVYQGYFS